MDRISVLDCMLWFEYGRMRSQDEGEELSLYPVRGRREPTSSCRSFCSCSKRVRASAAVYARLGLISRVTEGKSISHHHTVSQRAVQWRHHSVSFETKRAGHPFSSISQPDHDKGGVPPVRLRLSLSSLSTSTERDQPGRFDR